ncbi:ALP1-like protein [Tanacetum coccineum]
MNDSSFSDMPDLDDQNDIELIWKALQYDQSLQQQQAESSHTCTPIYRERDIAEARLIADNHVDSPKYLVDNLLDDIGLVTSFKINGVTFEKGYYLINEIYSQWATFVKPFTVVRDKKNALFKRRQEGARKDVERAFGVLK